MWTRPSTACSPARSPNRAVSHGCQTVSPICWLVSRSIAEIRELREQLDIRESELRAVNKTSDSQSAIGGLSALFLSKLSMSLALR